MVGLELKRMEAMASSIRVGGATLKPSPTSDARRRERPFLEKLLTAGSEQDRQKAIAEGRAATESRRDATSKSIHWKK